PADGAFCMETRHPGIARRDDSVLVVIDCQERLWKVISGREALEQGLLTLIRGARLLDVPVLVTEQNPQGLGPTIPSLTEALGPAKVLTKASFSCLGNEAFLSALRETDRGTVVLAGIEAHICVLQTALDALAAGFRVHVVADAAGTRLP